MIDKNPLVSVIVPVYNVEPYLRECLDSIVNQSYNNLEIILVDDGSTDDSGRICDDYSTSDTRIQVIHQQNGGLSVARNTGLINATGRYIYFLDSDDWIDNDMIEVLVNEMQQTEAFILFFDASSFADKGLKINQNAYHRKYTYSKKSALTLAHEMFIKDEYKPCIPLMFFCQSFLHDNNLLFEPGIIGEDELFTFQACCMNPPSRYVHISPYHRRIRAGSIMTSTKKNKKWESYYKIYNTMKGKWLQDSSSKKLVADFIIRITKSAMLVYREMTSEEQLHHLEQYASMRKDIMYYNGFGDRSLVIRLFNWRVGVAYSGMIKLMRRMFYA